MRGKVSMRREGKVGRGNNAMREQVSRRGRIVPTMQTMERRKADATMLLCVAAHLRGVVVMVGGGNRRGRSVKPL